MPNLDQARDAPTINVTSLSSASFIHQFIRFSKICKTAPEQERQTTPSPYFYPSATTGWRINGGRNVWAPPLPTSPFFMW